MNTKLVYCDGDSWTAGDIVDPTLFGDNKAEVHHPDNEQYRLPRVWPHKLGKLLNVKVLNKAFAGSSNDGIVRRVLPNVLKLLTQYKPEQLFVIIGWSSPERKDFFYDSEWKTIYPNEYKSLDENNEIDKFKKIYFKYFWEEEEYTQRYIEQNLLLHNFLVSKNVKHYFFDAFYETREDGMFHDKNFEHFITRYQKEKTFRDILNIEEDWDGYHPSELAHDKWAKELYKDIKDKL
jgi:lysophospholipase L1-like esterase|tara:strand:- start:65 stop:769 length:705 start_codon:yes stop_codon:yes gene_type:complete